MFPKITQVCLRNNSHPRIRKKCLRRWRSHENCQVVKLTRSFSSALFFIALSFKKKCSSNGGSTVIHHGRKEKIIGSMYGILTYIELVLFMVNVFKKIPYASICIDHMGYLKNVDFIPPYFRQEKSHQPRAHMWSWRSLPESNPVHHHALHNHSIQCHFDAAERHVFFQGLTP